jgi:hypothetical protein
MDKQQQHERLVLINRQAKRVERAAKILKTQSAQLIEGMADELNSQEAHDGSKRPNRD